MPSSDPRQSLRMVVRILIRPLARFCIARSLALQEFIELAKGAFIDIAVEELRRQSGVVNSSRISVLTGLRRAEVDRLYFEQSEKTDEPIHVLARVVGQWEQDPQFCTRRGTTRTLGFEGDSNEFFDLVRKVTTHIGPKGVLEEMLRTKTVEKTARGLRLLRSGAVYDEDVTKGFEIISRDIGDLISVGDVNLKKTDALGYPHARTYFDNIFESDLPAIQHWLLAETKSFHKRARHFLSRYDRDLQRGGAEDQRPAGCKVAVTTFGIAQK